MAEKNLIERNLPFNDRYIYMSIKRGSVIDGDGIPCDNCGKLICNIVHVIRKSDMKHFDIGTDCAETLSKAHCLFNNGQSTDYYFDISRLKEANRFMTQAKKTPDKVKIGDMYATVEYYNGKQEIKEAKCFTYTLKDFYPEFYQSISHQTA